MNSPATSTSTSAVFCLQLARLLRVREGRETDRENAIVTKRGLTWKRWYGQMALLALILVGEIIIAVLARTKSVTDFTPDGKLHKGPPPQLTHSKRFATYVRSEPNANHTASEESVLTLAEDGTGALYFYRIVHNKPQEGATLYWYWQMVKGKKPAEGSALVLTGHKHSTFLGAWLLDSVKDKEWGTLSPDGKTLNLFEMNELTIYTRIDP
jgi:hypothetical protein